MDKNSPWLEIKNVDAWLGNTMIFNSLDLELYYEDNTVILGPNGSGKSTLIKLINREIYPVVKSDSDIRIFGNNKINIWKLRSKIAFVSTDIEKRILPSTKINTILMSSLYGSFNAVNSQVKVNPKFIEKVEKIKAEMELEGIMNKRYGELSDGQKRILIISRALIINPKVLILDEPLNSLDLKSQIKVLSVIQSLARSGITLVVVTHRIESIFPEISRILLIKNGTLTKDGVPKNILTSKLLSQTFETPLKVIAENGYYRVFPDKP